MYSILNNLLSPINVFSQNAPIMRWRKGEASDIFFGGLVTFLSYWYPRPMKIFSHFYPCICCHYSQSVCLIKFGFFLKINYDSCPNIVYKFFIGKNARCKSIRSWCDGSSDRSFMVDLFSYFLFQSVLQDWCNKGCGMCCPVCGMMHIKEPLLLIRKSSPCGGSGFSSLAI